MKYLAALSLFLSILTVTLFTTPASSQVYPSFYGGGRVAPGYFYPQGPVVVGAPGFYGRGYYPNQFYPGFYPVSPTMVQPVIINDTGVVDNIYGPGASAARRLGVNRNSNLYHGW
ncbi:MAG: hypothetical protein U1F57_03760 [bacterium]